MMKSFIAAAALFAAGINAQVAVYGQCGGIGYTGSTTCAAGSYCSETNEYYSQCLPGTGPSAATTASTPSSTAAKSTLSTATSNLASPTTSAPSSTSSGIGTNPFLGKQYYANAYYQSEVYSLAIPSLPASLVPAASAVAEIGSFVWLDTAAKVPVMSTYLADIEAKNAAGADLIGMFVVYDLPDRDCAALASNGEYTLADNGTELYMAYIDSIVAIVEQYPTVPLAFVIEPDSLANLVTNLDVAECAAAESAYITLIEYALGKLNLPNVSNYIDAGHCGWLGWPANLAPAAALFLEVWEGAGKPASLRGLATNVANYNAYTIATPPSYTSGDANYDEQLYVNALYPLLVAGGWDARFIIDQSRSGKQPTGQLAWGDWCNVIGTGFGTPPTTDTGDDIVDSIAWIKPGGECDGTSNSSAPRYDAHCGYADALQPAPQAGTWFQAYFEQLLENANPPLA